MIYTLSVNILVAAVVFGLAGLLTLAFIAWTEAKNYALALRAMQRIVASSPREDFANSHTNSRNPNPDRLNSTT
jgi:hypothetical protein